MAYGRSGRLVKGTLGFLIYGEQGTRKSTFCLESLKLKREDGKPFRVLYIDGENGSIDTYLDDYENEGIDLQNLYILYTQSLTEVEQYIDKAKKGKDFYYFDDVTGEETDEVYLDADGEPFRPDMIVVDGVSLLYVSKQQSIVEFSKKRATVRAAKNEVTGWAKEVAIEGAGLEMKDYNTLKFEGQNLVLNLLSCGKHFAITMREEDEKVQIKDEKTKEYKTVPTGRKRPQGFKDVVYNVKTVIRLFKDTDGLMKGIIENKDRMKVYQQDEVIVEPSILAWQSVIDKNKGRKASVLTGTLKDSVKKEVQAIEEENGKINDDYEESEKSSKKLSTVEDYQVEIKQTLSKLTQVEKSKKLAELEENKLPKNYGSLNEIELLKKYLNIISN